MKKQSKRMVLIFSVIMTIVGFIFITIIIIVKKLFIIPWIENLSPIAFWVYWGIALIPTFIIQLIPNKENYWDNDKPPKE